MSKIIFLTSGTSWVVPSDWNTSDNTVECIGGGGGGGGGGTGGEQWGAQGGGSGAYSKKLNVILTPGASITVQVGSAGTGSAVDVNGTDGGDTWLNGANLAASSVGAKGGQGGKANTNSNPLGAGGSSGGGIGDIKYSGGNGGGGGNENPTSGV